MRLTCFGKYGPYPKANCACSCYMLVYNDKKVIIDLGCGSLPRVLSKIQIEDIDALVLSHLHADHMGDVLTLRYALAAVKKLGKRDNPLPVYLPKEPSAESGLITDCEMIDPKVIGDGSNFNICGIDTRFALMPHAVPSYAMSFKADGRKFVYSGDTAYNEDLITFSSNADMLLIEAAFLSENLPENAPHVSAAEAALAGKRANAGKLLLTHIFPEYSEEDILKEAREHFEAAEIIEELHTYEV
jgi:ribonuclease BN (tRNA processing enzyme)